MLSHREVISEQASNSGSHGKTEPLKRLFFVFKNLPQPVSACAYGDIFSVESDDNEVV